MPCTRGPWSKAALISPVLTTAWVVHELADGLSSPKSHGAFLRFLETLEADENTTLVEPDPALWRRGLALYRARPDKAWSLTDCISFIVMTDRGLTDALTSDHHFEQAGFRARSPRVESATRHLKMTKPMGLFLWTRRGGVAEIEGAGTSQDPE